MTIGGLKKTSSPLALVAAAGFLMGGMALTPAVAADLGGDCCADLEERVAELEATTARKGNRKVSLAISGWVARDFGWYEDAHGYDEFYSSGHGVSGSRVQFAGSAALTSSWTVGYVLRMRIANDRNSNTLKYAGDSYGPGFINPTHVDKNFIYFKNARLGTFVLGHAYVPTDGVAEISLGGRGVTGTSEMSLWNASHLNGFNLEQGSHETIAWVSPTLRGFTYSVAWVDLDAKDKNGNDITAHDVDGWDMALRYAGEFGPIRIAAGIGYSFYDDGSDGSNVTGSASLMHTPTGLNIAVAAGTENDGGFNAKGIPADGFDRSFWHIQGGVNRDFTGMGNTSIYAEYGEYDYDGQGMLPDVTSWGLGVVQHFDSAATEIYLAYRNWEEEGDNHEVNQIMAGARIKF